MRMKSFVFLFVFAFVLPSFSATSTRSGSGSLTPPKMAFKSWRVGRSPTGTNTTNKMHLSFITSTETECWVKASVGYKGGNQPLNTAPIDLKTVKWEFIDRSTGMELAEPPGSNWSGSHPTRLSGTTSFNVVAKLTLKPYNDSVYPAISTSCSHSDDHRQSRGPHHRGGKKMKFTIKFTAKTTQGDPVEAKLPLLQDKVDQLRQEYLDLTRKIPERGAFKDSDGGFQNFGRSYYNFGHYDKMLYYGLRDKHGTWTTKTNELYRRPNNKPNFTRSDLFLTSGYRNPHHNDHHARKTTQRATDTLHGLHQYGLALDVRGKNFDVDGDGNSGDQDKMMEAAKQAGATKRFKYSTGHVHADWRGSGWPPSNPIPPADPFSLPPQGTDSAISAISAPAPTPPVGSSNAGSNPDIPYACGIHSGPSGASSSHSLEASCGSTDSNGNTCTETNFYVCQTHVHVYPSTISVNFSKITASDPGPAGSVCNRTGSYAETLKISKTS